VRGAQPETQDPSLDPGTASAQPAQLVMGLGYQLAPFPHLPYTASGNFARKQELHMEKHSLKNCVITLKKVRDVYSGQFDTSVINELNEVIDQLEEFLMQSQPRDLGELGTRSLQMIATVIRLFIDIDDLMK
jgi:hypothetical protein